MRSAGRFVVEAHAHITTLYKSKGQPPGDYFGGLTNSFSDGEVEYFDNSPLTLYDMERYGVDMCLLKPSQVGNTNESQADLVERYPDMFRAFCADMDLRIRCARGEATWNLDEAADEVEAALKTGKFIGIGEFVPRDMDEKKVYTFKERLNEYRTFCELAQKYGVSIDFHDYTWNFEWDTMALLTRISMEYPDVPIIFNHGGFSIGGYIEGEQLIRKACAVAGRAIGPGGSNIFLETGSWCPKFYEIALRDPNVGVSQLIWGGDYGHVPQYIVSNHEGTPPTYSTAMKRWPRVPAYQIDWWGWSLHQIDRIRDWVTQDEINLILGGNAARVWDLPVPQERMFMCGRPDVWGVHWEKSVLESK